MARDHGRVLCKIWQDKDFRALSRSAQALYIQLLSQPNVNNAGVLPFMVSKWAKGCDGMTPTDVLKDLAVLVDTGFLVVDTDTEEVLIRSFIRNDGGMKHKYIFKNALTMAEAVESEAIRRALAAELRRIRNADARRVAEILDPSEPDPSPVENRSERDSNAEVNPSESHSNPIEIPSESGMAFEPHSNHCGEGEGEGVGDSLVVGHLGEFARTHAGDASAHTREAEPTTPQAIPDPWCEKHPGGTADPCRACGTARTTHEKAVADAPRRAALAQSERAHRAAEDRRLAVANCSMCDSDGQISRGDEVVLCDHDPGWEARTAGGRAEFQKALAEMRGKRSPALAPEEIARIRTQLSAVPDLPDADDPSPEPSQSASVPSGPPESTTQDHSHSKESAHGAA